MSSFIHDDHRNSHIEDTYYYSESNVSSPSSDRFDQLELAENTASESFEGQLSELIVRNSWGDHEIEYEYNNKDYIKPNVEQRPVSIFSIADFMSNLTKVPVPVLNQSSSPPTSPKDTTMDDIIDGNNTEYGLLNPTQAPLKVSLHIASCAAADEVSLESSQSQQCSDELLILQHQDDTSNNPLTDQSTYNIETKHQPTISNISTDSSPIETIPIPVLGTEHRQVTAPQQSLQHSPDISIGSSSTTSNFNINQSSTKPTELTNPIPMLSAEKFDMGDTAPLYTATTVPATDPTLPLQLERDVYDQQSSMNRNSMGDGSYSLPQEERSNVETALLPADNYSYNTAVSSVAEDSALLEQELGGEEPQLLQVTPTLQSTASHREHSSVEEQLGHVTGTVSGNSRGNSCDSRGSSSDHGGSTRKVLASRILEFERDESPPHRMRYAGTPILQSRYEESRSGETTAAATNTATSTADSYNGHNTGGLGQQRQSSASIPVQCRLRVESELDALIQYKAALLLQSKLVDQLLTAKEAVAGDTAQSRLRCQMSVEVATEMLKEVFLDCELLGSIVLGDTQLPLTASPLQSTAAHSAVRHSRRQSSPSVGFGSGAPRLAVSGSTQDRRSKALTPASSTNSPGVRMDLIRRTPTGVIDGAPLTSTLRRNHHSSSSSNSQVVERRNLFSANTVIEELLKNPSAVHSLAGNVDNYCVCCRTKLVDIQSQHSAHKKHMHCKHCIYR